MEEENFKGAEVPMRRCRKEELQGGLKDARWRNYNYDDFSFIATDKTKLVPAHLVNNLQKQVYSDHQKLESSICSDIRPHCHVQCFELTVSCLMCSF